MEKMNDGTLSKKLENLFLLVKNMEDEIALIDGDTSINRRIEAIQEYPFLLKDYQSQYQQISEQLALYANVNQLLDFIAEWAVFDPSVLIGLAEKLNLTQAWSNIPVRMKKNR